MPFNIIRNDIVRMNVDAIVNAANSGLKQGGGVCGRIFSAAGEQEMTKACDAINWCEPGSAVITPGFKLPAKYVIHTVGPIWQGGSQGEEKVLRSAYRSSLELALEHDLESIAFPLISSGVYGYPYEEAFAVALDEINRFLFQHDMHVTLVMFDQTAVALGFKLRKDLKSYIDDHYVDEHLDRHRRREFNHPYAPQPLMSRDMLREIQKPPREAGQVQSAPSVYDASIDGSLAFPKEKTFSEALLNLIDTKGMTDAEAYKRSNIDRRLFSKIRSNPGYAPSKSTVLAFTIGLRLSVQDAQDLLARAGFAFSPCDMRDLIVRYFLERNDHDIARVNAALYDFDQSLLGV
jgi:O-acetyl-ADP-ribose deacetylase (regulator of RNase III)